MIDYISFRSGEALLILEPPDWKAEVRVQIERIAEAVFQKLLGSQHPGEGS